MCELLIKGKTRLVNDKIFMRWALMFQDQMSLDEFKRLITPVPQRSAESILKETNKYLEMFNQGYRKVEI